MVKIDYMDLPTPFCEGTYVRFTLSDGSKYKGVIDKNLGYFINLETSDNSIIFRKLGIMNPKGYVKTIVGYEVSGIWPEVKSLDDLHKVLSELYYYEPDRIPEDKKVVISDDKEKPFTLSIDKRKNVTLNFKV